jgi:hypothetical protein
MQNQQRAEVEANNGARGRGVACHRVPDCATASMRPDEPADAAERRRASWSFVAEAAECHPDRHQVHTDTSPPSLHYTPRTPTLASGHSKRVHRNGAPKSPKVR